MKCPRALPTLIFLLYDTPPHISSLGSHGKSLNMRASQ